MACFSPVPRYRRSPGYHREFSASALLSSEIHPPIGELRRSDVPTTVRGEDLRTPLRLTTRRQPRGFSCEAFYHWPTSHHHRGTETQTVTFSVSPCPCGY